MNSLEKFNEHYKKSSSREYEISLKAFFDSQVRSRLPSTKSKVLDLGAGSMSMFEETDLDLELITAIDFSSVAIELAQGHSKIHYQVLDLSQPHALKKDEYDLIYDSHCLHCIEDPADRKIAFKNILEALNSEGLFAAEMMVQPTGRNIIQPYKYIPSARDLEAELLETGFKIIYFMIIQDLKFSNENGDCDLLRVISRK